MTEISGSQEIRRRDNLWVKHLSTVGPVLFDDGQALQDTVSALSGQSVETVDGLKGAPLQMGWKAHMLFYEAAVGDTKLHFVTYLSRGSMATELGRETLTDYTSLSWLANQTEQRLRPEVSKQFGVIKPAAQGEVRFNNKQFPFYTMPFLSLGELHVDLKNTITIAFPYFRYCAEYTNEMADEIQPQVNALEDLGLRFAISGMSNQLLAHDEVFNRFALQRHDLLRADCLVYLLSEDRFPREHDVQAGDYMAKIYPDSLDLRLITVRGGFTRPMLQREFYELLMSQIVDPRDVPFRLFDGIRWGDFVYAMDEAKEMLRS